jgi:ATP-binding cassette subfamily B protein
MNNILSPNLWSFIWHFLQKYKRIAVVFAMVAMFSGLWAPLNSLLFKYIIDNLENASQDNILSMVLIPAIFFVVNYEAHNLCWRIMGYINYKYEPVIKNQIISETFGYVHKHTHQFFQDNLAGSIASQITILADNIEKIVHDISRQLLRSCMLLGISFVSMYSVHPQFFYVLLTWFIIFAVISLSKSAKLIDLSRSHAKADSVVSGELVDSITNASNVRIFAQRNYETSYLGKSLSRAKKTFQIKELFEIKLRLFQGASISIMLGFMLYILIKLRINNIVTIGDFALILSLSAEVAFMTWWGLEQIDDLNKAVGKCKQSLSSLFVPLEIKDKENAPDLIIKKGEINFQKVKFHYKGTSGLFEDKSVIIKAGQKVGLVGYSGSGKSSFVNLILRLYDVTDGQILIDGQDIASVTQDSLRSKIAMIPQDPSLFHRSLMENIRYGRIEASDDEVT